MGNEVPISGGGFWTASLNGNKGMQASFPSGNGWLAIGRNQSGANQDWNVIVTCLQG